MLVMLVMLVMLIVICEQLKFLRASLCYTLFV